MPRKAPDEVVEHRVSLGSFERSLATESLRTAQASAIGQTVVGIAAGVGGIGVLIGALTFAAWKAPGVIKDGLSDAGALIEDALGVHLERDETGSLTVEQGVGGFAGIGGVIDQVFDASSDGLVALRREGQALAQERGAIAREISAYCSLNASTADAVKCNAAHERKDAYFARLKDYRARVKAWAEATGKDDSNIYGGGGSAFASLGDIDPNYH